MKRLAFLFLLALARPASAAEVWIDVEGSVSFVEVYLGDVVMADGMRQDKPPFRIHGGNAVPGNVVGFSLFIRTLFSKGFLHYRLACSPNPWSRSMVVVYADAMPSMGWGRFTGQMGACRKVPGTGPPQPSRP